MRLDLAQRGGELSEIAADRFKLGKACRKVATSRLALGSLTACLRRLKRGVSEDPLVRSFTRGFISHTRAYLRA